MVTKNILGIEVCDSGYEELLASLDQDIIRKRKRTVFAVNPEKIYACTHDNKLKRIINDASYKIPDGIGVIFASILNGQRIKKRILGVELMDKLCELAAMKSYSVFLYGAKPSIAGKAADRLKEKYPKLRIVGHIDGYNSDKKQVVESINREKPNILFVALGSPRQEQWINDNKDSLDVNLFQGVGGSFDVLSGTVKRAPKFFRMSGLEWLYRLLQDPKRINRQRNLPKFASAVIRKRFEDLSISKKTTAAVALFLALQPLIDLLTAYGERHTDNAVSFGAIIRALVMAFAVIYILLLSGSRHRRREFILLGALLAFSVAYLTHGAAARGLGATLGEVSYLLKFLYFPTILIFLWSLYSQDNLKLTSKIFIFPVFLYSALLILAQISGTTSYAYESLMLGNIGWFYSPNEISAILAIAAPIVMAQLFNKKSSYAFYIFFACYVSASLILGTKATLLAILFSVLFYGILFAVKKIKQHRLDKRSLRYFAVILVAMTTLAIVLPITPVGRSVRSSIEKSTVATANSPTTKAETILSIILSNRNTYLAVKYEAHKDDSVLDKLFGTGYTDPKIKENRKNLELDFHDIYYNGGLVALLVYLGLLGYIAFAMLRGVGVAVSTILHNIAAWKYILATTFAFGLALVAGHVLSAPSVSTYVAALYIATLATIRRDNYEN